MRAAFVLRPRHIPGGAVSRLAEACYSRGMARIKKVVSLRGAALPVPQANKDVINQLNTLLAAAKSGHISGLGYFTVSPEGHTGTGWEGNAEKFCMIAGSAMLAHRIVAAGTGE